MKRLTVAQSITFSVVAWLFVVFFYVLLTNPSNPSNIDAAPYVYACTEVGGDFSQYSCTYFGHLINSVFVVFPLAVIILFYIPFGLIFNNGARLDINSTILLLFFSPYIFIPFMFCMLWLWDEYLRKR